MPGMIPIGSLATPLFTMAADLSPAWKSLEHVCIQMPRCLEQTLNTDQSQRNELNATFQLCSLSSALSDQTKTVHIDHFLPQRAL